MNYKLKLILFFGIVIANFNLFAQDNFQINEFRSYSRPEKYADVTGQPYLLKDWALGSVTTINKGFLKDAMLRYDEIENQVILKGKSGEEQILTLPVKEFTITDAETSTLRTFRSGFSPSKFNNETTLFEVLVEGKTTFLKRNNKTISENKEYSGKINRTVTDAIKHYLVVSNNEPVLIKLDPKAITTLLSDKESELNTYIKANKLNVKKQDDAVKLIAYYNTL